MLLCVLPRCCINSGRQLGYLRNTNAANGSFLDNHYSVGEEPSKLVYSIKQFVSSVYGAYTLVLHETVSGGKHPVC